MKDSFNGRTAAQIAQHARRGRIAATPVYMIEGEPVTVAQMAARLGVSETTISNRLHKLRKRLGPITWEGLRG